MAMPNGSFLGGLLIDTIQGQGDFDQLFLGHSHPSSTEKIQSHFATRGLTLHVIPGKICVFPQMYCRILMRLRSV